MSEVVKAKYEEPNKLPNQPEPVEEVKPAETELVQRKAAEAKDVNVPIANGEEVVFYSGPGLGACNKDTFHITSKRIVVYDAKCICLWRSVNQLETALVTGVSLAQSCSQRKKGAGVVTFYTCDPLYAAAPIVAKIPKAHDVFYEMIKWLNKGGDAKKEAVSGDPIFDGKGYCCCWGLGAGCCPAEYQITTLDAFSTTRKCRCCCGGCTEVRWLKLAKVFQAEVDQCCCQFCTLPCCKPCRDAGQITLYTVDSEAMFQVNIPKAKVVFDALYPRLDFAAVMNAKFNAMKFVGLAADAWSSANASGAP